jgi:zinc transport system permease protein
VIAAWWDASPFSVIPGATGAALLAGAFLPLLGLWIVMQRVVFLGVTLSQVAAAGVALGLLLHLPALPLGLLLCALLVAGLARRATGGIGSGGDSALGAAFCLASALALLFISRSPADLDQVSHILHGNLIFASGADVRRMGAALAGGTLLIGACFPRVLFCAFDGETAAALGLRVRRWLLLLFSVLAVVLTLSMRTTGALLTFALLVLPALAALQLRAGLRATFALSAALGMAGALSGLLLAVRADLHLESSIVVSSFVLVPLARLARASVLLALVAAAALAALVPLAAPAGTAPRGPSTAAHAPAHDREGAHPAFLVDVHLAARRQPGHPARVRVDWTLSTRVADDGRLPDALWLIVTGDGVLSEHALVEDTRALERGPAGAGAASGSFVLEEAGAARRLDGQLWSGPSGSLDALPLADGVVVGCPVH